MRKKEDRRVEELPVEEERRLMERRSPENRKKPRFKRKGKGPDLVDDRTVPRLPSHLQQLLELELIGPGDGPSARDVTPEKWEWELCVGGDKGTVLQLVPGLW